MPLELRAAFPVLDEVAYLNAGTCGPVATVSAAAIQAETERALTAGRAAGYYERLGPLQEEARVLWGALLGAPATEIALTNGASDGIARILGAMAWQPGDLVVTTDEEHPGVLGPLGALVRRHGVGVRQASWDGLAAAADDPAVRLIVASHVGWLRGRLLTLAPLAGLGVPIVLDAAQSAGAIPVDLGALREAGVVAYAAAGQKWTCGPVATGALWVAGDWHPDDGHGTFPTYGQLAEPARGLMATTWPDARRFDSPSAGVELTAGAVAALRVLDDAGWPAVHRAGIDGAARLAAELGARGREVTERGPTTLVTWREPDPEGFVRRALDRGVVVRSFPGEPFVRASVGAWNTAADLDRLLDLVGG